MTGFYELGLIDDENSVIKVGYRAPTTWRWCGSRAIIIWSALFEPRPPGGVISHAPPPDDLVSNRRC